MATITLTFGLVLLIAVSSPTGPARNTGQGSRQSTEQQTAGNKQLYAVRGEVTRVAPQGKGQVAITIKPAKDFGEVTVVARENDIVGPASSRQQGGDLLGLVTGSEDAHENERITAAELQTGDIVSVIYNPQTQNRALEIYIH